MLKQIIAILLIAVMAGGCDEMCKCNRQEGVIVIDEIEKQAFISGLKEAAHLARTYGDNIGVPEYTMVANAIIIMISAYIDGVNGKSLPVSREN